MGLTTNDPHETFHKVFEEKRAEAPVEWGKDDPDKLLHIGDELLKAYKAPPNIIGIEERIEVILDEEVPPIIGYIDLITVDTATDALTVYDLKTSRSRQIADTTSIEDQLGLYVLAMGAQAGGIIVLAKTKSPQIETTPLTVTPGKRLQHEYRTVYRAMKNGNYYRQRGWQCTTCGYKNRCHREA